jgi:hypothetical protein
MLKKLLLIFLIIIWIYNFSNLTYAVNADPAIQAATDKAIADKKAKDQEIADKEKKAAEEAKVAHDAACTSWDLAWKCIDKPNFTIKVDDISPWMNVWTFGWDTKKTVNFAFATIIQKLMIGLGSLSLLIMTVWAWYIVLHNWQDELLNKWKSIFMSWVYAMVVALSSYYIIVIVRYILYGNWNS